MMTRSGDFIETLFCRWNTTVLFLRDIIFSYAHPTFLHIGRIYVVCTYAFVL